MWMSSPCIRYCPHRPSFLGAEEPPATPHRTLVMRSANGSSYRCFLPVAETDAGEDGEGTSGAGTSLTQVGAGGEQVPGLHGALRHSGSMRQAVA